MRGIFHKSHVQMSIAACPIHIKPFHRTSTKCLKPLWTKCSGSYCMQALRPCWHQNCSKLLTVRTGWQAQTDPQCLKSFDSFNLDWIRVLTCKLDMSAKVTCFRHYCKATLSGMSPSSWSDRPRKGFSFIQQQVKHSSNFNKVIHNGTKLGAVCGDNLPIINVCQWTSKWHHVMEPSVKSPVNDHHGNARKGAALWNTSATTQRLCHVVSDLKSPCHSNQGTCPSKQQRTR